MNLLNQIMERAKANPQRIVLPEGTELRTLKAADIILKNKAAHLLLIGNKDEILTLAYDNQLENISNAVIIDPEKDTNMAKYAALLYEIRKSKGMTLEEAEKLARSPLYLA